jgi:hypothetical protein
MSILLVQHVFNIRVVQRDTSIQTLLSLTGIERDWAQEGRCQLS